MTIFCGLLKERLCSPGSNATCAVQNTGSMADSEAGRASEADIIGLLQSHWYVWAVPSFSSISSPPRNHCQSSPVSRSHSSSSSFPFSNTCGMLHDKLLALCSAALKGNLWLECLVSPIYYLRDCHFAGEGIFLFEALLKIRSLLGQTHSLRGVFDANYL